jgi:hypothetical protein
MLVVLGDTDASIVFDATCSYLRCTCGPEARGRLDDALEWLGRRLAIRNDALFAALLAHGDDGVHARLLAQRHTTTSARLRALLTALRVDVEPRVDAFLREWRALESTETSHGSPGRQDRSVSATDVGRLTVSSQSEASNGLRAASHVNTTLCQATR